MVLKSYRCQGMQATGAKEKITPGNLVWRMLMNSLKFTIDRFTPLVQDGSVSFPHKAI